MPKNAASVRGDQMSLLAQLTHGALIAPSIGDLLTSVESDIVIAPEGFTLADKSFVREFRQCYDLATKLPMEFVKDYSKHTARSLESWKAARTASNFSLFEIDLTKMVDLNIQKAHFFGFEKSPYDALLNVFEKGLTEDTLVNLFNPLRDFSKKYLKKILATPGKDFSSLKGTFPINAQIAFNKRLAKGLNFNFESGRMDVSTHPFTSEFGTSKDVRITTRYDERNLTSAVMATIHEVGHALYEQGISESLDLTFLSSGLSFGIHESQSRMWENFVGRSSDFWVYWFPILQTYFPDTFKLSDEALFVNSLNNVTPSLIRVDADEVTYNLHIILRFEIERLLINGKLKVSEIPEFWNTTMYDYLGVTPENDAVGCLQDIHWAMGGFGYFPTYTLGNLYAAQFYNSIKSLVPNLSTDMKNGSYTSLLAFLREKIHTHGSIYTPAELCLALSGEKLNPLYLEKYLTEKFDAIYSL